MTTEKKPIQFTHVYTVEEYDQVRRKAKMLIKDGNPVKCHKCAPSIVPSHGGNFVPVYEHCTTHCSRALIGMEGDNVVYVQTCEVQNQKFLIDNAKSEESLKIIK